MDLVADVPERVAAFKERRGFRGRMDWFVYENYDPRYTDFIALGRQIGADSSDGDALAVADDDQRREGEAAAALDDLGQSAEVKL